MVWFFNHSCALTNTGLDSAGPLTCRFFSIKYYSTAQSAADWICRCRTMDTEDRLLWSIVIAFGWILNYIVLLSMNFLSTLLTHSPVNVTNQAQLMDFDNSSCQPLLKSISGKTVYIKSCIMSWKCIYSLTTNKHSCQLWCWYFHDVFWPQVFFSCMLIFFNLKLSGLFKIFTVPQSWVLPWKYPTVF